MVSLPSSNLDFIHFLHINCSFHFSIWFYFVQNHWSMKDLYVKCYKSVRCKVWEYIYQLISENQNFFLNIFVCKYWFKEEDDNIKINQLSANITKWSGTLKQFVGKLPTNCLSVFDHFVGLALDSLNGMMNNSTVKF